MNRRAWAGVALMVALLLAVVFLPGLSGVRGNAVGALQDAGRALTIPSPTPSPAVSPTVTPEQLASRAAAVTTDEQLTVAEGALADLLTDEALAAYTVAVEALVPVLEQDGRTELAARARKIYDALLVTYDAQEPDAVRTP